MITRILYRSNIQGVLNYVSGKPKSTVVGFQNTYSDTNTDMKFFGRVLYHLGNRHDSEKRYAHISLNLPRGEHLNDTDFFELSKRYMEHMGYGEQPYVVIRHHDTKHEHVHIVSSTIKEDCLQINLSNDIRRSIATQKYLEKEFELSPSPDTRNTRELPKYEMPEFRNRDSNGVRFYIQDIVNIALQKYKVRSFNELSRHLKKHHIELRTVERNGRVGVSYGVDVNNGYKSRFINGYTVHPQLSGPKLQKVFEQNRSSKLLPMVKKRLEKQINTAYGLFKTINPEHLPDILKIYQKLDCKVDYNEEGKAMGFTIYDKSGYVLKSDEIAPNIGIQENPELFGSEYTQMYAESEQLQLELQRCIREAYKSTYQNTGNKILYSEHIDRMPIKALVMEMARSERFLFLKKYLLTDNRNLGGIIQEQFNTVKDKLYDTESHKEEKELNAKAELIKKAIGEQLFEAPQQQKVLFELIHSLGTDYDRGILRYTNSYKHQIKLNLGHIPLPDQIDFYASPGFIKENEKVLDGLLNDRTENEIDLRPSAMFLPLMFPNLYKAMAAPYRQKFEMLSLKSYHKYAERMQVSFEKSPRDYIAFFNAKGFYFERNEEKLCIGSIYSKYAEKVPLSPKTQAYLESSTDLDQVLDKQAETLKDIETSGRDNLKSLWCGHLIERGQYKKAAYLLVLDGVRPNLPLEILEYHMQNGLKETLGIVSQKQVDKKQARLLRQGVYALGNLLGSNSFREEELFNGFKDEFTDFTKYKGRGLSM
ncbi:relaxase/mobilization nuclease domain-containing protein [Kriegella aquimaris]|uniref:Relaxase/Mobilisation nuclease domain-containing protein n=1 Tax=Kriegella aquimaris TaxID=192904 RepID=A0A1G9YQ33_9FLAO|nr:relaxase/mobilization nuclease domain-containing protein [Kriegella aquimaris]SDN11214.1 Relaxase/Mobilisation nuclease domain-containing protein [Kriegella aquimaris]